MTELKEQIANSNSKCEQLWKQNEELAEKIKEAEKLKATLKDDLFRYYLMSKEFEELKRQHEALKNEHNEFKSKKSLE
jgi:phage shock protein A